MFAGENTVAKEREYCLGDDGPITLAEIMNSLVNSGADGPSILSALRDALSDEEWDTIVQSFGIYYAS